MRLGCVYEARIQVLEIDYDESYIGYTNDLKVRKYNHLRAKEDSHFHRAIRKYGAENITWRILEDGIEEHRLPDREELWIAYYDTYNNGLNMTPGGEVSPMKNPEVAAKHRAIQNERVAKGEHHMLQSKYKEHQSKWQKDRAARGEHHVQDPEVRAKSSATKQAQIAAGTYISQQPEWKAKTSASTKRLGEQGKHPMQNPKTADKAMKTRSTNKAEKQLESQKEIGQLFFFDIE